MAAIRPAVSVIVPVHNGAASIAECLQALLQQTYPSGLTEILIVDNNSSDGTPEVVSRYPVRLIYERERQTSYAARNAGLRQAQGELVAFTDSDCVPDAYWLANLLTPFEDPAVVGVSGKVASWEPTNLVEAFTLQADPLGMGQQSVGGRLCMITANVAYRRQVLLDLGGFRSEMYTGADVDLGWRLQSLPGCKVCEAPLAVVYHKHRTTLSGLHMQYQRYGFGEILLDTLYRDQAGYPRTPGRQMGIMLRQVRAILIYILAFFYRLVRAALTGWDTFYVAWPALWFVAESSNLLGKFRALVDTRFFTRDPYLFISKAAR